MRVIGSGVMFRKMLGSLNAEGMGGPAFIMLVATVVGGGCNFLFQISMQNYAFPYVSEINTLLAILYIVSVPSSAIANVMIRYVSKYKAEGQEGAISWLMRRTMVVATVAGTALGLIIVLMLTIPQVREALMLTSYLPSVLIGIGVLVSLMSPVGAGPLQGLQWFTRYGLQSVVNYVLKLTVGLGLVLMGYGVSGAVGGVVIGLAFGAGLSFIMVRKYLRAPGTAVETKEIWRFTVPSMIGVLCFTILTQVDVIFAALLFDKDVANIYTGASMLAKIVLFLPQAIAAVMFPKIAKAHAEKGFTHSILKSAVLLTLVLSSIVTLAYLLAPEFILGILVPGKYPLDLTIPVLQILAVAMMLLGLANLFMLYGLATDGHAYIVIMGLTVVFMGALMAITAGAVSPYTPEVLAGVMVATGAFNIILSVFYLFLVERERTLRLPL